VEYAAVGTVAPHEKHAKPTRPKPKPVDRLKGLPELERKGAIHRLVGLVIDATGQAEDAPFSKSKKPGRSECRMLCVKLLRDGAGMSFGQIADALGYTRETAARQACRLIEGHMEADAELRATWARIRAEGAQLIGDVVQ